MKSRVILLLVSLGAAVLVSIGGSLTAFTPAAAGVPWEEGENGEHATVTPTPAVTDDVVLCPPGVYPQGYAVDCLPSGAAAYLTRMASLGYTYPPAPLPAEPLPETWFALPKNLHYAQVRKDGGRSMYPSLEDALNGTRPRHFPPGFIYVAYTRTAYYHGKRFYMVDEDGWWMRSDDLWAVEPSHFHGVLFSQTPPRPFGWVVKPVATKRTPDFANHDYTAHTLERYEMVQVYDTAEANGIQWYMIAPDEWLPQNAVGLVFPRSAPPEGVPTDRWIDVNLFEQTLAVYEDGMLKFATLTSTGKPPFWTAPGTFQIYEKKESTRMRGAFEADRSDYYQLAEVPWTMYYDDSRALHGAYWHDYFGYKTSHGCINLSISDAHWLYAWARVGDWVHVWDPSGQTPEEGGGGGP